MSRLLPILTDRLGGMRWMALEQMMAGLFKGLFMGQECQHVQNSHKQPRLWLMPEYDTWSNTVTAVFPDTLGIFAPLHRPKRQLLL